MRGNKEKLYFLMSATFLSEFQKSLSNIKSDTLGLTKQERSRKLIIWWISPWQKADSPNWQLVREAELSITLPTADRVMLNWASSYRQPVGWLKSLDLKDAVFLFLNCLICLFLHLKIVKIRGNRLSSLDINSKKKYIFTREKFALLI